EGTGAPGLFGEATAPTTLDVDPEHPVVRRMSALSDPGTLLIRRAWDADRKRLKSQITVDEVRKLNNFFGLSATDGGKRVVIVDCADEMNPSAANAILKVLEEPPAQAVLLLVSHQPDRLLPTIRSRCRCLRLAPLAPDALAAVLDQAGCCFDQPDILAELAGGSAGDALRLLTNDGPRIYAEIVSLLSNAPRMDRQAARRFADAAAARGAEDRLEISLRLFNIALFRLARTAAGHPPKSDATPGEIKTWQALSAATPAHRWAELQQSLGERLGHGLAVNVDTSSLLLDALLQVGQAVHGERA
ncbi:MAG: DNA polymerase III subunit delta', partial [Silicimonas sp.]|nr:DNA polymerase III subunit delta' [Silicimonas sp.]